MKGMKIVPYKDSLLHVLNKFEAGILTDYYKNYYVTAFLNAFQINIANDVTECLTKVQEISDSAGNAHHELINITNSTTFKTKTLEHVKNLKNMIHDLDNSTYVSVMSKSSKKLVKP